MFNPEIFQAPVKTEATQPIEFRELNLKNIREKLMNIDKLSDKELYDTISNNYQYILEEIFIGKSSEFIDLFMNSRFLTTATQAIYSMTLTESQKQRSNKMAYDYFTIPEEKRDAYVASLLMGLSKTVNRDVIPLLCALNLPENVASLLALARYSSSSEVINIKRLNKIMYSQPMEIFTEQMICDVYLTLFDHIGPLFEGIMLDVISPSLLNINSAEIYGRVTLAMLDIIVELPSLELELLIDSFQKNKAIMYADNSLRVNLESCSPEDYPKLFQVIDQMKASDNYTLY